MIANGAWDIQGCGGTCTLLDRGLQSRFKSRWTGLARGLRRERMPRVDCTMWTTRCGLHRAADRVTGEGNANDGERRHYQA